MCAETCDEVAATENTVTRDSIRLPIKVLKRIVIPFVELER